MNERFVSEETVVSHQCKSKTLKFGIKLVRFKHYAFVVCLDEGLTFEM